MDTVVEMTFFDLPMVSDLVPELVALPLVRRLRDEQLLRGADVSSDVAAPSEKEDPSEQSEKKSKRPKSLS